MLLCVALGVRYHPPKQSELIPGVAIRLGKFLQQLDQYGIPHQSEECIRKELRQSKYAATRMKQFFHKEENLGKSARDTRCTLTCKGCVVIPRSDVPKEIAKFFPAGVIIIRLSCVTIS